MANQGEEAPCSRIYRHLHGSPMLVGIPVQLVLVLLGLGCLGGFGGMSFSKPLGISVLVAVIATWIAVAFAFRQDRAAVPLFFLRLVRRFPPVTSSFTRSYLRVLLVDEEDS